MNNVFIYLLLWSLDSGFACFHGNNKGMQETNLVLRGGIFCIIRKTLPRNRKHSPSSVDWATSPDGDQSCVICVKYIVFTFRQYSYIPICFSCKVHWQRWENKSFQYSYPIGSADDNSDFECLLQVTPHELFVSNLFTIAYF